MRVENNNAITFNGNLIINSSLSSKPQNCVKKIKNELQALVKSQSYNLYLRQNYSRNEIEIAVGHQCPFNKGSKEYVKQGIPATSNFPKYIDAANKAIADYESQIRTNEQKEWELQQKQRRKQDAIDDLKSILYIPLFIVNDLVRIVNPKWAKDFEKLIERII